MGAYGTGYRGGAAESSVGCYKQAAGWIARTPVLTEQPVKRATWCMSWAAAAYTADFS